jgi:hypothetical protein
VVVAEWRQMKTTLIALLAFPLCLPVLAQDKPKPLVSSILEKAIRKSLFRRPAGELTKAVLAKATHLDLGYTQITDACMVKLRKALPKCRILSKPTK